MSTLLVHCMYEYIIIAYKDPAHRLPTQSYIRKLKQK